jgi:hypothetical protein
MAGLDTMNAKGSSYCVAEHLAQLATSMEGGMNSLNTYL